jgi:hypothetical protein
MVFAGEISNPDPDGVEATFLLLLLMSVRSHSRFAFRRQAGRRTLVADSSIEAASILQQHKPAAGFCPVVAGLSPPNPPPAPHLSQMHFGQTLAHWTWIAAAAGLCLFVRWI